MYWRINCAEHLLLLLEPDAEGSGGGGGGPRRLGRQRSVTYSEGRVGSTARTAAASTAKDDGAGSAADVRIIRWSCAPSGHLLAGISAQGVYLWQMRPFMLLSKLEYEANEELGQMVDVIWQAGDDDDNGRDDDDDHDNDNTGRNKDYGTLFVLLSSGYIYEIAVYRRSAAVLEYRFETQHYWARGAGEEDGLRRAGLAQRRTYRLAPGSGPAVCAAAGGAQGALVATRTHVIRLAWSGVVEASTSVSAIHGSPLAQVRQMAGLGAAGEAYLFGDGSVHVVRAGTAQRVATGEKRIVCMAYSARSGVLAMGADSGDVLLLIVSDADDGDDAGLQPVAEATEGSERAGDVVTALAWTADGAAVACAHASGHVVVRSALGYALNTSRVRQAGATLALCWGAGGTRLFVLGDTAATALAFARAAVGTGVGEGTAARVCVFTDDKVLVHDGAFTTSDGGGADAAAGLQWQAVQVPAEYVAGAWPLRFVAVSGDGRHVAVAGRRGVAVGGVRSGRWRLLRTREQEDEVRVRGGLLWLGDHVVAACGSHVVVFAGAAGGSGNGGALDGDAAQHVDVGARVVAMSAHDALLLVVCADARVRQLGVFGGDGNAVAVGVRGVVDLGGARLQLARLRSVQWVPSAQFARAPALLVHEGTRLRVVDSTGGRVVSARAELTVTSGVHFGNMHSTVWWFDGRQLHAALVSLEDFMEGSALRCGSDGRQQRRLAVQPSFYPVAIAAALGMAVGIDQDWALDDAAAVGLAQLPVRAKLYLPSVLARMLSDSSGEHDALLYAACFEHLAFFAHAMEILLHEAVEEDGTPELLRRVVAMLGNFAAFPEIVVHCARKTEAASWPALFACVGGPERFFRRCLSDGRLQTATQCLIILHTLAPKSAATEQHVLMLLARAVDQRCRTLCVEILRFVRMTAASDAAMGRLLGRLEQGV
ncbi:WD40 repeat protein [Coemansia erecta]|uniref:WD40 repeat protein n=1 Tax=Coemansia erecta TaxID=147472 RepID=A0A9W7Y842_9FUNG|nr:WD40 repeat protein [Coemansia erecta]